jgi:hypothetical protein
MGLWVSASMPQASLKEKWSFSNWTLKKHFIRWSPVSSFKSCSIKVLVIDGAYASNKVLSTGSSVVFLNGVRADFFLNKRAIRQVYPLCPLIFVFATDFLQTIVSHAMIQGHLTRHLSLTCSQDCPVIQYIDDTSIIFLFLMRVN